MNGAGHNPIVISDGADIEEAVRTTLHTCLYNQGQDCAAPNSILVKQSQLDAFKYGLLKGLAEIEHKVGAYSDYNNIVGPNTHPENAFKIAEILNVNRKYCIYGGQINIMTGLVQPVVIEKPLQCGPSLKEFFAPIIML